MAGDDVYHAQTFRVHVWGVPSDEVDVAPGKGEVVVVLLSVPGIGTTLRSGPRSAACDSLMVLVSCGISGRAVGYAYSSFWSFLASRSWYAGWKTMYPIV